MESRRGHVELTGLALALGACLPLVMAVVDASAAGRRALDRVIGWHLARGMAVEFSRREQAGGLREKRLEELYFVSQVLRYHPQCRRYLAQFRVEVEVGAREARARVRWRGGTETETAVRP